MNRLRAAVQFIEQEPLLRAIYKGIWISFKISITPWVAAGLSVVLAFFWYIDAFLNQYWMLQAVPLLLLVGLKRKKARTPHFK